jgi:putative ATPase
MIEDMFSQHTRGYRPLADRVRPKCLEDYKGQSHILGQGMPLKAMLDSHKLHSMIFWGPPGVGKTTLALLVSNYLSAHFISISAVLSGVKEIRAAILEAEHQKQAGRDTVLFIDEVHRFNKSQQDAFLPHVEKGTVIFIGATTENPSFELNNALLSRARIFVLNTLSVEELKDVLRSAMASDTQIKEFYDYINDNVLEKISLFADGDARRALNLLELCAELLSAELVNSANTKNKINIIDEKFLDNLLQGQSRRFDKGGDIFYEQISALHKAVRGSSPDAALYWFSRMLDGGCDPLYIARRVLRMASEDIGNADPRALSICLDAWSVYERLGSPEGELAIAQAVVYLASAPKSNAVYSANNAATAFVKESGSLEVPMHLRNAPTAMMKDLEYGKEYNYAHHEQEAFVAGENYLPEQAADFECYFPVERGLEVKIKEKLLYYKQLNNSSTWKRYKS